MLMPLCSEMLEVAAMVIIPDRDVPVEVAGYTDAFLPTFIGATGTIEMRWWSVKRGLNWAELSDLKDRLTVPIWQ